MATTDIYQAFLIQMQGLILVWIGLAVLGCVSAYWLFTERMGLKRYANDILIRKRCMKERKPLGTITNKSGIRFEFMIESDPEMPGLIKYKDNILRSPNLASSNVRGHLPNGLPYVDYVVSCDFPVTHQSAAAIDELLKYVRDKYPQLTFMDEIYIVEGIFKKSKYAYEDCVQLIHKYIQIGVDIPDEIFEYPDATGDDIESFVDDDDKFPDEHETDVMGEDLNE